MMYADMIDPSRVQIVNAFPEAMSWPKTVAITGIALVPGRGVVPQIQGLDRWPDFTPPGWSGPLRFTLWAGFQCDGQWAMSGFMQFWAGRQDTGANPLEIDPTKQVNQWQANWAYGRWPPLDSHVPKAGELMALMVTAGDARDGRIQTVAERSQIVTVPLALEGTWAFTPPVPPPAPVPSPDPAPGPMPPDPPIGVLGEILARLEAIEAQLQRGFTARVFGTTTDITPKH